MCNTSAKIASTATPKEFFRVLCALPRLSVVVTWCEFMSTEEHENCTIVQLHYEKMFHYFYYWLLKLSPSYEICFLLALMSVTTLVILLLLVL